MPIELLRVSLLGLPLGPESKPQWKFRDEAMGKR
jgi:hypothetical protein